MEVGAPEGGPSVRHQERRYRGDEEEIRRRQPAGDPQVHPRCREDADTRAGPADEPGGEEAGGGTRQRNECKQHGEGGGLIHLRLTHGLRATLSLAWSPSAGTSCSAMVRLPEGGGDDDRRDVQASCSFRGG